MRTITIRKIPDEMYRTLKRQAVDRDIPLGIYMLQIVEAHVRTDRTEANAAMPANAVLTASTHDSEQSAVRSTDAPITDTPEQGRKG